MGRKLDKELKLTRPLDSLEQEVYLNVVRTADHLAHNMTSLLKDHGLTAAQYNVLRILRGSRTDPLSCTEIGQRMVTRDPDITRLLDRLEKRGLVQRTREREDRRVITIRITDEGLEILRTLDGPIQQAHRDQMAHMDPEKLRLLSDLLEEARREG